MLWERLMIRNQFWHVKGQSRFANKVQGLICHRNGREIDRHQWLLGGRDITTAWVLLLCCKISFKSVVINLLEMNTVAFNTLLNFLTNEPCPTERSLVILSNQVNVQVLYISSSNWHYFDWPIYFICSALPILTKMFYMRCLNIWYLESEDL